MPQSSPYHLSLELLEAMQDATAPHGALGHAMRISQQLIHKLNDYCDQIQITGNLRHLSLNGHHVLKLIAVAPPLTDLLGQPILDNPNANKLDQYFSNNHNEYNAFESSPPQYIFDWQDYTFIVTSIPSTTQLGLAQIMLTGPTKFRNWFSSSPTSGSSKPGALPWGHYISNYTLYDHNHKPVPNIETEREVFQYLDYPYIHLIDRLHGNPRLWELSKEQRPN